MDHPPLGLPLSHSLDGAHEPLPYLSYEVGHGHYRILSQCTILYIENDAEIFPAHYTWKVAEKGFKMAFMMNKLAMINSCEFILEK